MNKEPDHNTPEDIIEQAVAELYRGFFRLREEAKYQEEYDTIGTIINMLTEDRVVLRHKYGVK